MRKLTLIVAGLIVAASVAAATALVLADLERVAQRPAVDGERAAARPTGQREALVELQHQLVAGPWSDHSTLHDATEDRPRLGGVERGDLAGAGGIPGWSDCRR